METKKKAGIIAVIVVIVAAGVFLYFSWQGNADDEISLEERAKDFITKLSEGEFEEAHKFFDDTVANQLTVDGLQSVWNQVINNSGEFKEIVETRETLEGGHNVVYVTTEFENAQYDIQVAFDDEAKIAGFHFFPG